MPLNMFGSFFIAAKRASSALVFGENSKEAETSNKSTQAASIYHAHTAPNYHIMCVAHT